MGNARTSRQLCEPLPFLQCAGANSRLKASMVNAYTVEVRVERGLSGQDKVLLIRPARAM